MAPGSIEPILNTCSTAAEEQIEHLQVMKWNITKIWKN